MRFVSYPSAATSARVHKITCSAHRQCPLLPRGATALACPPARTSSLPTCSPSLWQCRRHSILVASAARGGKKGKGGSGGGGGDGQMIQIDEDGSDLWRLDPAIEAIRNGGVLFLSVTNTHFVFPTLLSNLFYEGDSLILTRILANKLPVGNTSVLACMDGVIWRISLASYYC